jgi:hypothetical protein
MTDTHRTVLRPNCQPLPTGGVKVSVATIKRERLVLGTLALPGNPYDDHR